MSTQMWVIEWSEKDGKPKNDPKQRRKDIEPFFDILQEVLKWTFWVILWNLFFSRNAQSTHFSGLAPTFWVKHIKKSWTYLRAIENKYLSIFNKNCHEEVIFRAIAPKTKLLATFVA